MVGKKDGQRPSFFNYELRIMNYELWINDETQRVSNYIFLNSLKGVYSTIHHSSLIIHHYLSSLLIKTLLLYEKTCWHIIVDYDKITFVEGVWLNGRVVVSKTIGCGFKSYCPCHKKVSIYTNFFFVNLYKSFS